MSESGCEDGRGTYQHSQGSLSSSPVHRWWHSQKCSLLQILAATTASTGWHHASSSQNASWKELECSFLCVQSYAIGEGMGMQGLRVFVPWMISASPGAPGFLNTQAVCNPPHAWQHPNLLALHEGAKHSQILTEVLGNAGQSWNEVIKPSLRFGSNAAQHISLCHPVHRAAWSPPDPGNGGCLPPRCEVFCLT